MRIESQELLRKLASGVRPGGTSGATTSVGGTPPVEAQSFSDLLAAAKAGKINGNAPVKVASGSKVELTSDQLKRLSPVVDAAEAKGANRLLALIDGQAVTIDVGSRTVEGATDAQNGKLIDNVDAVMVVPDAVDPLGLDGVASSDPGAKHSAGAFSAPKLGQIVALPSIESVRNSSVAELLSKLGARTAA